MIKGVGYGVYEWDNMENGHESGQRNTVRLAKVCSGHEGRSLSMSQVLLRSIFLPYRRVYIQSQHQSFISSHFF